MSPVILAVEAKPRGVATVTLAGADEEETCRLPIDTVVLHHLRAGAELEEGEWRAIRAVGQQMLATRHGLDLLSRRHRTEQELHRALTRRWDEDAARGAVDRLRELGYLDDATWAKNYVASGAAAVRGRTLLRHELRHRGIADPLVAEALEEHDDRAAARTAAMKRIRSLQRLEPEKRKRRLYDFLRRRGFNDAAARPAMEAALATIEDSEDADPEGYSS